MQPIFFAVTLGLALISSTNMALAEGTPDATLREQGKTLFMQGAVPACAICHTLKDAEAAGAIGPDLDELKPDFDRVLLTVRTGVGVMPSFAETLTDEQIKAIATYVVYATGGNE